MDNDSTTQSEAPRNPLAGAMTLSQFQESRKLFFPGFQSFMWFFRNHKERLVKAGAVLMWRGSWLVDAPRFDDEMFSIARDEAWRTIVKGGEVASTNTP